MNKINVYTPNISFRTDRRESIIQQFQDKELFNLIIVPAIEKKNGFLGLWQTFYSIVETEANAESDYFIFCEDDHVFTHYYSDDYLLESISKARSFDADLLSGGVAVAKMPMKVSDHLFFVSAFNGMQFVVIFKKLYKQILECKTTEGYVTDILLSSLAKRKFVIFPYISVQKDFGYSDATSFNNEGGRVEKFFRNTQNTFAKLEKVYSFYKKTPTSAINTIKAIDVSKLYIPTYIINLKSRKDRLAHIVRQFDEKKEFQLNVVEACKDENGAVGLWKSIKAIVSKAKHDNEDCVLICEDDHFFTRHYNKEQFLHQVYFASILGAEILSGGVGGFGNLVPLPMGICWVDWFWCTQFIVVYKAAYDIILNARFGQHDVADGRLSEICTRKMVITPFISEQMDFGYSDITPANNHDSMILRLFDNSRQKLQNYFFAESIRMHVAPPFKENGMSIKEYLNRSSSKALQIGCGNNLLQGWLNTDVAPQYGATFMDVSQRFPIPDNSLEYIYAEHLMEFFNPSQLEKILKECCRVLKPNGIIRIASFSADKIIKGAYSEAADYFSYATWNAMYYGRGWQNSIMAKRGFVSASLVLSNFINNHPKVVLYDKRTLTELLRICGFSDVVQCKVGQSKTKALSDVDSYKPFIPLKYYDYETLHLEAINLGKK